MTIETKRGIRQAVRRWWYGEDKPFDIPGVIGLYHEQHWTSRACHCVVDYVRQYHWQLIMALIAVVGVIVAWRAKSS